MTTKNELVSAIQQQLGLGADGKKLTHSAIGSVVDALVDHINVEVRSGRDLTVAGLGTFKRKTRDARQGRNPATGEAIQIAAKRVPAFKPAKAFTDAVA